jgi:hypothetical protein
MKLDPTDPLFRPISIADAMARTGRSRRTIDRWIHDGRLHIFRLDNPPEDVLIERDVVALEKACRDARRRGRPPRNASQIAAS